ncbi:hypothetical protein BHE74_00010523 [Ensete ventricosum]|nr:hypothetical protein BHE74_00010523 [Ensete ventricosum]
MEAVMLKLTNVMKWIGNAVTEVPLLDEVDATTVKHEEDCLVQDSTLMRRDQVIGGGRRVNTSSSPSAAGPQAPNGARTTRRERKCEDQCGASSSHRCSDVLAGSCMKKTTAMSAAQVVFCNTLVDRVCRKCGGLRRRLSEDAAGCKDTEVAGSDCDVKQRKGGNRVDVLRKKS